MRVLELEEESPLRVPEEALEQKVALRLHRQYGQQVQVEFPSPLNQRHYVLRARGYVGQLPLGEDLVLHLRPKLPLANLFDLLEWAWQLQELELSRRAPHCRSIAEVFEHLAGLLARKILARVRAGLRCDYVEREADLPWVRGRLLAGLGRKSGEAQVRCRFQEHTADVMDNRILAWTLYRLRTFPVQDNRIQAQIRQAFHALAWAVDLGYVHPSECHNRSYHRLNQDYQPLHALCRFFLEHSGPALGLGECEFLPFAVHLPSLFEAFVAGWLRHQLRGRFEVRSQYWAPLEGGEHLAFRVDLVLSVPGTGQVLGVLDTKYKRSTDPDEEDVQQVVAYAVRLKTTRAFLVYPSAVTRPLHLRVGGIQVQTLIFDLGLHLEAAGANFLREVLDQLPQG